MNPEIIGNTATLYMKDGSIKSGRILGFRTEVEKLITIELETKQPRDPHARVKYGALTEFLDASRVEAIDPYCK
jgi:hypothetical protein